MLQRRTNWRVRGSFRAATLIVEMRTISRWAKEFATVVQFISSACIQQLSQRRRRHCIPANKDKRHHLAGEQCGKRKPARTPGNGDVGRRGFSDSAATSCLLRLDQRQDLSLKAVPMSDVRVLHIFKGGPNDSGSEHLRLPSSPQRQRLFLMSRRLHSRPLDSIVDLSQTSFDRPFAGPEFCRSLNRSIAGINVPAPKAGLDLLHVIVNGAMLHFWLPAIEAIS